MCGATEQAESNQGNSTMQTDNDAPYAILFVDDEEKTRKYFDRAFAREYRVLTAPSVAQARELLEKHGNEIGVLISDQRMPEEKGVVLLRHAREHYPHIVRILTTAYSDLDDAIESVNSGEILRYITKPWDLKLLGRNCATPCAIFICSGSGIC